MTGGVADRGRITADIVFPDFESAEAVKLWLSERFATETDPLRILSITAEALGRFLGAARIGYGEFEPGIEFINIPLDWARAGLHSIAGRHPFYADSALTQEYRRGRTLVATDVATLPLVHQEARLLEASSNRAFVAVPLIDNGELVAMFVAIDDKPRAWTEDEVTLISQTGARIWGALEHLRLTARLRESEEQFRLLAENLPGLCWVGDENGALRWGNSQWHAMFDGTSGEYGDPTDVCHPDDLPIVRGMWRDMRKHGEPVTTQLRMRGRDGLYRPFLSKAVPIRDARGAVVRWCGVQIDLSDKHAQDRRQTVLRAFNDQTRDLTQVSDILLTLAGILAEHLDVTHFLYGETALGDAGLTVFQAVDGVAVDDPLAMPLISRAFEALAAASPANMIRVITDNQVLDRRPDDPVGLVADRLGTRSGIIVPIVRDDRLVASIALLVCEPRTWTRDEIELSEELAARVWATVSRASAEAALQERERNQAFLISWSDRVRGETSAQAIMATTLEWIGRHLGVTRTTYAETDETGRNFTVLDEWRESVSSIKGNRFSLESVGASVDRAWIAGEIIRYDDVAADPRLEPAARARYADRDILAFVSMPLVEDGRMRSALSIQQDRPRRWRKSEIQLMRDIAERTWIAIERARAQAALLERERNQAFLIAWNDGIRNETGARAILARTLAQLGEHLGVSRANYAEATATGDALHVLQEWNSGVVSVIGETYPLSVLGEKVMAAHLGGQPLRADDIATDERFEGTRELYQSVGVAAALTLPMVRSGEIVAVLSVQQTCPRHWTDSEVELVREVADRTLTVLERAHSEERLAESEAQLAAFLENAPVAMHLRDGEGRYVRVNPEFAKALGRHPDDIVGKHPNALFSPRIAGEIASVEARALAGQVVSQELALDEMHGYTHALSMAFPITGSAGVARTGGFTLDLTDRKRAEAALARSREALYQTEKLSALGSLLAGVSHELNNPLSIVVAQAVMMERQSRGSELAERAQKIRRAADRCARIVQTFLAMARQKRPERAAVDLNAVAMAAHELADYGLRTDGVVSVCDLAPGLPMISADTDQLHQIIINLIVNAQQAMVEAGTPERTLTLRSAPGAEPGTVVLEVSDNGPGIPEEARRRIFEPFFTTKPQGQGTGVGLSFSQGLAEAHGGRLELVPSDAGACFRLTLPIDPDQHHAPVSAELPLVMPPPPRRALVIDDEAEIAESLADFLSIEGFVCDIAVGGAAAKARLAHGHYDLVISDLRMPDVDGPALHGWIAAERPDLVERVGFATGDTLGAAAERFLAEAKRPVLEKPFTPEAVTCFLQQMDLA